MLKIKGTTKIVGIIGYPIRHTLSPLMHNSAFMHIGLDYVYIPMEVQPLDLKRAVQSMKYLNITGINVTVPYKEEVISYLDEILTDARTIGAVNTIHNSNGRLLGYNTDGEGFISSLRNDGKVKTEGKRVVLFGAGGVGRAIGTKLAGAGISVMHIYDIDLNKQGSLTKHIKKTYPKSNVCAIQASELKEAVRNADVLINATPIGMHRGDPCVVEPKLLHKKLFVFDAVYNTETRLLKEARKRGIGAINGLGMLIYQGALSFKIWTGREAPLEIMKKAVIHR
jgi:shikimate dehydrogenase